MEAVVGGPVVTVADHLDRGDRVGGMRQMLRARDSGQVLRDEAVAAEPVGVAIELRRIGFDEGLESGRVQAGSCGIERVPAAIKAASGNETGGSADILHVSSV